MAVLGRLAWGAAKLSSSSAKAPAQLRHLPASDDWLGRRIWRLARQMRLQGRGRTPRTRPPHQRCVAAHNITDTALGPVSSKHQAGSQARAARSHARPTAHGSSSVNRHMRLVPLCTSMDPWGLCRLLRPDLLLSFAPSCAHGLLLFHSPACSTRAGRWFTPIAEEWAADRKLTAIGI